MPALQTLAGVPRSPAALSPASLSPGPLVSSPGVNPAPIVPITTTGPYAPTKSGPLVCQYLILAICPRLAAGPSPAQLPSASGRSSWVNLTPTPIPGAYPSARYGAESAFDSDSQQVLMFGGETNGFAFLNDLWAFSAGNWTELQGPSSCTPTTCPSGRLAAGFAYDPNSHEAVVFGGLNSTSSGYVTLGDTWVYSNGGWTNVTRTAGLPPSPRFSVAMTFASEEGYILLFGGTDLSGGLLGDTWTFAQGRWSNLTLSLNQSPEARASASIADSPTGYAVLYGGYGVGGLIQVNPSGTPCPEPMWWFHDGAWTPATYGCVGLPRGGTASNTPTGPCGRSSPMISWSPKNHLFVLFGGSGVPSTSGGCPGSGISFPLNDTWAYLGSPGSDYDHWVSDPTPSALTDRESFAYAPDYADGYAMIFGGVLPGGTITSDTWRYFALVSATFKGPANLTAGSAGFSGTGEFLLGAFGGSGSLDFIFNTTLQKTVHPLTGVGECSVFTDQQGRTIPPTYSELFLCTPDPTAYNVFRISVVVWDSTNSTQRAYANWTTSISPPEALTIHSQYAGIFYEGFSLSGYFGIYAQISNQPVTSISATIDGRPMALAWSNASELWWNGTADMGQLGPGGQLVVTAAVSDWSETANMSFQVAVPPDFIQQLAALAGVITKTASSGRGSFGQSYSLTQSVPIPIGKLFGFSIPVPLIAGNYSLVPNIALSFTESSDGNVTLTGLFTFATPGISLGLFKLKITVSLTLVGKLELLSDHGTLTFVWLSAKLTIAINADFSANIPIYGFKFDVFGYNVSIGFNIDIDINPSFALSIFLSPSDSTANDMLEGVDLMVTEISGRLSLPISVTANFGFVVGSVSAGGKLSMDVTFQVSPGQFEANNLWVNGSIFGKFTIIIWSATWNILGPGQIYHWTPSTLAPVGGVAPPGYDDGSSAVWSHNPRTYNSTTFDQLIWSKLASAGSAISELYPSAEPTAAGAYDGAYVFYTDDRVNEPVQSGLTVTGLRLDASSNDLAPLALPADPGYLTARPSAATLPDGSVYVLWNALALSDAAAPTPAGVSGLFLHGARYVPSTGTWGPVQDLTRDGFAYGYAIDSTSDSPQAAVLVAPSILPQSTTPETLRVIDLGSRAVLSNSSVTGLSAVTSFRSALGALVAQDQSGNFTLRSVADGSVRPLVTGVAANASLIGAKFLPGSPHDLLLWYRNPSDGIAVVDDLSTGRVWATVPLAGDVRDVEGFCGGGTCSIYASNRSGVAGWSVAPNGATSALPGALANGVGTFGLAPVGRSLLLYAVVAQGNGSTGKQDLYFAELGSTLPAVTAGAPAGPVSGGSRSAAFNAPLFLGVPLLLAVAVLILIAYRRRRPGTSKPLAGPPTGTPEAGPPQELPPKG